jgi:hypothetical protein
MVSFHCDGQSRRIEWRDAFLSGALAAGSNPWRWWQLTASNGAGFAVFSVRRLVCTRLVL